MAHSGSPRHKKYDLDELRSILKKHLPDIQQEYDIRSLELFGSYIHGTQKRRSDLDILVEFSHPVSLLEFIKVENTLSDLLGVPVDLVDKKSLKPRIRERILAQAIPP